ncbi:MAG: histone deacetylase [Cyanobacteria bacterium SW_9_44_58]|nr:MAG: histone deacetylase [Cyanobacteria bacterium SW_9_44_58]
MLPIIYSEDFLKHRTGRLHPERPERLSAIVEALQNAFSQEELEWRSPTPIEQREIQPWIEKLHTPEYHRQVMKLAQQGGGKIDMDTPVSADSYEIALLALSAWFDGVDQVLSSHQPALVLARPPGHHAEKQRGMGFCLFSNCAIAAHYALTQPQVNRVAILDWDVHHGNGTQSLVEKSSQIAYCSLHQSPCYPGTGKAEEKGDYNNVLNIPMSPGSTWTEYHPLIQEQVIPFLSDFGADLLIVSAGYDANHADPLADVSLKPDDYYTLTQLCLSVTPTVLFGLEGGYALEALGQSVVATARACLA